MAEAASKTSPTWFLYIVETSAGALYTGITTDVERRFAEHAESGKKTARFLRGKGPLTLKFSTEIGTKSQALKAELAVKAKSRSEKLRLIDLGKLDLT